MIKITGQMPRNILVISSIMIVLGLMTLGYWTLYLTKGLPLDDIPLAAEGINAVLAIITGIGLLKRKKWAFATGILVSGFWLYGTIGGLNIFLYDIMVHQKLNYQSPIGGWTDAILFVITAIWAIILFVTLWRNRKSFI